MVESVSRSKSSRGGPIVALGILIALVAGYFSNCFGGLGLPGPGTDAPTVRDSANSERPAATGEATRTRVVVQGEQCRVGDDPSPGTCEAACAKLTGTAEIEATAGTQRTVDALRKCLQARGVKVQIQSE